MRIQQIQLVDFTSFEKSKYFIFRTRENQLTYFLKKPGRCNFSTLKTWCKILIVFRRVVLVTYKIKKVSFNKIKAHNWSKTNKLLFNEMLFWEEEIPKSNKFMGSQNICSQFILFKSAAQLRHYRTGFKQEKKYE